ncbi:hypothetical protein UCRPA7_5039 [Phaeoacremonium minimum UCRPA7]|uniref:Uncharacterized protein n=1 Tax=Phaeoacremonium minimum (strain UCR-PA7) TaxID=1286976 RepID=R8BJE3_PHAM7|nr:hypothetical protein UCRPA7_5039 [Phaeoacremonium minimum UCRPA7]EON99436.1 hypothetical protein UCRPA7_5039 [Phaeoacremonium minimum UCRPA7]
MLSGHLEAKVRHHRNNIKDGETKDNVNMDIEILPKIAKDMLAYSRKRKAESPSSGRPYKTWREALEVANKYAMESI